MILWAGIGAAVVAVGVHALLTLSGAMAVASPFAIMQGQRMLLAIFIAAFATAHRDATVYLLFSCRSRRAGCSWWRHCSP